MVKVKARFENERCGKINNAENIDSFINEE